LSAVPVIGAGTGLVSANGSSVQMNLIGVAPAIGAPFWSRIRARMSPAPFSSMSNASPSAELISTEVTTGV
jgi:hypothetical protein